MDFARNRSVYELSSSCRDFFSCVVGFQSRVVFKKIYSLFVHSHLNRFVSSSWQSFLPGLRLLFHFSVSFTQMSGTVAAVVVGFLSFFTNIKFGFLLITFFMTSSKITKVGVEQKRKLEDEFKEGLFAKLRCFTVSLLDLI
jgi:hypothetical protein